MILQRLKKKKINEYNSPSNYMGHITIFVLLIQSFFFTHKKIIFGIYMFIVLLFLLFVILIVLQKYQDNFNYYENQQLNQWKNITSIQPIATVIVEDKVHKSYSEIKNNIYDYTTQITNYKTLIQEAQDNIYNNLLEDLNNNKDETFRALKELSDNIKINEEKFNSVNTWQDINLQEIETKLEESKKNHEKFQKDYESLSTKNTEISKIYNYNQNIITNLQNLLIQCKNKNTNNQGKNYNNDIIKNQLNNNILNNTNNNQLNSTKIEEINQKILEIKDKDLQIQQKVQEVLEKKNINDNSLAETTGANTFQQIIVNSNNNINNINNQITSNNNKSIQIQNNYKSYRDKFLIESDKLNVQKNINLQYENKNNEHKKTLEEFNKQLEPLKTLELITNSSHEDLQSEIEILRSNSMNNLINFKIEDKYEYIDILTYKNFDHIGNLHTELHYRYNELKDIHTYLVTPIIDDLFEKYLTIKRLNYSLEIENFIKNLIDSINNENFLVTGQNFFPAGINKDLLNKWINYEGIKEIYVKYLNYDNFTIKDIIPYNKQLSTNSTFNNNIKNEQFQEFFKITEIQNLFNQNNESLGYNDIKNQFLTLLIRPVDKIKKQLNNLQTQHHGTYDINVGKTIYSSFIDYWINYFGEKDPNRGVDVYVDYSSKETIAKNLKNFQNSLLEYIKYFDNIQIWVERNLLDYEMISNIYQLINKNIKEITGEIQILERKITNIQSNELKSIYLKDLNSYKIIKEFYSIIANKIYVDNLKTEIVYVQENWRHNLHHNKPWTARINGSSNYYFDDRYYLMLDLTSIKVPKGLKSAYLYKYLYYIKQRWIKIIQEINIVLGTFIIN